MFKMKPLQIDCIMRADSRDGRFLAKYLIERAGAQLQGMVLGRRTTKTTRRVEDGVRL